MLLGATSPRQFRLNLDALGLPVRDLSGLEGPFSEEEILHTIKSMPLDEAPGSGWIHNKVLCIMLAHH